MANRVLAGNRASGGYGLYVSRPGNNVLNCANDKLMFNTNSGESGTAFFSAGHFQVVPTAGGTGGTAPTVSSSTVVAAGSTASPSYQNFASNKLMLWGAPIVGFTANTDSTATILGGNLTGSVNGTAAGTVASGAAAGATANQDSTASIRAGTTLGNISGTTLSAGKIKLTSSTFSLDTGSTISSNAILIEANSSSGARIVIAD